MTGPPRRRPRSSLKMARTSMAHSEPGGYGPAMPIVERAAGPALGQARGRRPGPPSAESSRTPTQPGRCRATGWPRCRRRRCAARTSAASEVIRRHGSASGMSGGASNASRLVDPPAATPARPGTPGRCARRSRGLPRRHVSQAWQLPSVRVAGEGQLASRREDAHPVVGVWLAGWQQEGRLGEVRPAREGQHAPRPIRPSPSSTTATGIAAQRLWREDVHLLAGIDAPLAAFVAHESRWLPSAEPSTSARPSTSSSNCSQLRMSTAPWTGTFQGWTMRQIVAFGRAATSSLQDCAGRPRDRRHRARSTSARRNGPRGRGRRGRPARRANRGWPNRNFALTMTTRWRRGNAWIGFDRARASPAVAERRVAVALRP